MTEVNFLEFFPYTWIVHFIRAFVFFNISHAFLKDKYNSAVTFISIMTTGMLYSYISLAANIVNEKNEGFVLVVYYSILFTVLCFTTIGNFMLKVFAAVFSFVVFLCIAYLSDLLMNLIFESSLNLGFETKLSLFYFLSNMLGIFSLSFVFVFIIRAINSRFKYSFYYKSKLSFLFLFPATHVISLLLANTPYFLFVRDGLTKYYFNHGAFIFLIVFSAVCMALDISMIFIIDHIEKIEKQNIENERKLMKNQLDYQQTMLLKNENGEFRKIKHDFSNILVTAKGFIEIGKLDKALSVLQKTNDDLTSIAGVSLCSNETINTILYIKKQQAKEKNIELISDVSESYAVLIDDYDLCRLLSNIVDNSVNAVDKLQNDRISKIFIEIDRDSIVIKSENKFDNQTNKSKARKSKEHGNGIGIIKQIAEKYNGKYTSSNADNIWLSETILDNKKSESDASQDLK